MDGKRTIVEASECRGGQGQGCRVQGTCHADSAAGASDHAPPLGRDMGTDRAIPGGRKLRTVRRRVLLRNPKATGIFLERFHFTLVSRTSKSQPQFVRVSARRWDDCGRSIPRRAINNAPFQRDEASQGHLRGFVILENAWQFFESAPLAPRGSSSCGIQLRNLEAIKRFDPAQQDVSAPGNISVSRVSAICNMERPPNPNFMLPVSRPGLWSGYLAQLSLSVLLR